MSYVIKVPHVFRWDGESNKMCITLGVEVNCRVDEWVKYMRWFEHMMRKNVSVCI